MADKKRVLFGTGYEYDINKTREENWKAMKAYYAKLGIDVGEMPPDDGEIDKLFKDITPQLDKIFNEVVGKSN